MSLSGSCQKEEHQLALLLLDQLKKLRGNTTIEENDDNKVKESQQLLQNVQEEMELLRKQGLLSRAYALSMEAYLYSLKDRNMTESQLLQFLQHIMDLEKEIPSFQVGRIYTEDELLTLRQLSHCLEIIVFRLIENPLLRNLECLRLENCLLEYNKILKMKAMSIKNYLLASSSRSSNSHLHHSFSGTTNTNSNKENSLMTGTHSASSLPIPGSSINADDVKNTNHHNSFFENHLNEILFDFDRLRYFLMIVKNEETKLKESKELSFDEKKLSYYQKIDEEFQYLLKERKTIAQFTNYVVNHHDVGALCLQLRSAGYTTRVINAAMYADGAVLAARSHTVLRLDGDEINEMKVKKKKVVDFYLFFPSPSKSNFMEQTRKWQFWDTGVLKNDYIYLDEVHSGYAQATNGLLPMLCEEIESIVCELLATDPEVVGKGNFLGLSLTAIGHGTGSAVASLTTFALSNKLQKMRRATQYKASQVYAFDYPGVLKEDYSYFHQSVLRQYNYSHLVDSSSTVGDLLGFSRTATANNYFKNSGEGTEMSHDDDSIFHDVSNAPSFATYLYRVQNNFATENRWKTVKEEQAYSVTGVVIRLVCSIVGAVRCCFRSIFSCYHV